VKKWILPGLFALGSAVFTTLWLATGPWGACSWSYPEEASTLVNICGGRKAPLPDHLGYHIRVGEGYFTLVHISEEIYAERIPISYFEFAGISAGRSRNEAWWPPIEPPPCLALPYAVHNPKGLLAEVIEIAVPLWQLALLLSVYPGLVFIRRARRRWRRTGGIPCESCRYDLTMNTSGVCPECGVEVCDTEVSDSERAG
jgi:hypothetical protein